MEPMEADLHQIVRSGQTLSNSHIQFFTYQLLRGMKVSSRTPRTDARVRVVDQGADADSTSILPMSYIEI